jgi:hypothetical protein
MVGSGSALLGLEVSVDEVEEVGVDVFAVGFVE